MQHLGTFHFSTFNLCHFLRKQPQLQEQANNNLGHLTTAWKLIFSVIVKERKSGTKKHACVDAHILRYFRNVDLLLEQLAVNSSFAETAPLNASSSSHGEVQKSIQNLLMIKKMQFIVSICIMQLPS